jgi:hypothetical protein
MNNKRHTCEYKDCWRMVDPQYKYCFGHNNKVKVEELLKGGENHDKQWNSENSR